MYVYIYKYIYINDNLSTLSYICYKMQSWLFQSKKKVVSILLYCIFA